MNKNKKDFPLFFLIDNNKISNKNEKAERFNNFFTSVGPKLASKIQTSN